MKYTQKQTAALLKRLGVTRYDFMPPQDGTIKFCDDSGVKVASGDYKIILSHGPAELFTRAWAIGVYDGFPIVDKLSEDEAALYENKSLDDAFLAAIEIGERIGADFVYRAMHIFVAVFNFRIESSQEELPPRTESRAQETSPQGIRHQKSPWRLHASWPNLSAATGDPSSHCRDIS